MANTLPEIIGFDTDIQLTSRPSRTWIIDRNTMQVGYMDEGLEAVRQAVEIALNVDRFRWQIYNTNFGNELNDLIGDDADYIMSEFPRMVDDALSVDDRVIDTADYVSIQTFCVPYLLILKIFEIDHYDVIIIISSVS